MTRRSDTPRRAKVLPLGALAAGFGLAAGAPAFAQTATPPAAQQETVLPTVRASVAAEPTGKESVQATTTRIGKGQQDLRDVPQSVTVVTERLIDDRNLDTLKDALKNTAGITFLAAEGGEEDIRLRGFSMQSSGDIFVDGVRDPAFYDRDSFNWDRLEVLRGSASMLFGRGSTGGVANQVSKLPGLLTRHEAALTLGTARDARATGDFNWVTGENAALRVNLMAQTGDDEGVKTNKRGVAPSFRWGIGTADEFLVSVYHLDNRNGIHYGLPWLALTTAPDSPRTLLPIDGDRFYGMASDYNASGVTMGTLTHTHRFADRSELRTTLRVADYERDLRASAIRFSPVQPNGLPVTVDTFSDATVLTRGTQIKTQAMKTVYVQIDYSGRFKAAGLQHEVLAGIDVAREKFRNYATDPLGPVIVKPTTTVGTPNDGAWVDEASRALTLQRSFESQGVGLYAQDMIQLAPAWKVLAGLRLDRFSGEFRTVTGQGFPTTNVNGVPTPNPCYVPPNSGLERSDSLWSRRFGVLYQPTPESSYHLSYGTSFNTSGDTYQFDPGTANVGPEGSRNIELGARFESAGGNLSTRVALFHSTKTNERNRDADSVNACNYVLSGKRHAAGVEIDVAGRITPAWEVFASWAWIPVAEIDAASPAAPQGETVGARPGLTPRHSGTVWTTYQLTQKWRVGAGLNLRSRNTPVGITSFSAPGFVTADAMAEYAWDGRAVRLNVTNLADKLYADTLYRGHYIAGKPRTVQLTLSQAF